MLSSFINSKLNTASYKILPDRSYFGEIKALRGVWASARSLEACRRELQEVLEDWLMVKVRLGERVTGLSFSFDKRRQFRHA